jgi:hypothetical protein
MYRDAMMDSSSDCLLFYRCCKNAIYRVSAGYALPNINSVEIKNKLRQLEAHESVGIPNFFDVSYGYFKRIVFGIV